MGEFKRNTTDRFFGNIDERLAALKEMFQFIESTEPDQDVLIDWIIDRTNAESRDAVSRRLAFLDTVEFIQETAQGYRLCDPAQEFLSTEDARPLLEQLTAHVRGFKQLLAVLQERPLTDDGFRDVLAKHPDFTSEADVALRHREWLQMLGYVRRPEDYATLTEKGERAAEDFGEYVLPEDLDIMFMTPDDEWDVCIEEGVILLGWPPVADKDLDKLDSDDLEGFLGEKNPDAPEALTRFQNQLNPGTLVVAQTGIDQVDGLGVVTGDYERREGIADDPANVHTREVEWFVDMHEIDGGTFVPDWSAEHVTGEQPFRNGTGPYRFKPDKYRHLRDELLSDFSSLEESFERLERTAEAISRHNLDSFEPTTRLVNQGTEAELEENYLQAPFPADSWQQTISRATVGDVVIHNDKNAQQIVGKSILIDHGQLLEVDNEDHLRRWVQFDPFENKLDTEQVLNYLNDDEFIEETDYYLYNKNGNRTPGYLFDLPEAAVRYIFSQAAGDHGIGEDEEVYADYKSELEVAGSDISIPSDGLHFEDEDWSRLSTRIERALSSGKHVLLFGPPGTGKTKLARGICEEAVGKGSYELTTASADWSSFDTVGGYRSQKDGSLAFDSGVILDRFQDDDGKPTNEWLVIDELNRADIDKAFGAMFSALTGESVTLPFETESGAVEILDADRSGEPIRDNRFYIPEDWRMIATMNTLDKTSLYEMSYAFMRRWAFVPVGTPDLSGLDADGEKLQNLIKAYVEVWAADEELPKNDSHYEPVGRIWQSVALERELGPAVIKDIYRYVADDSKPEQADYVSPLLMYVFPQLEGLRKPSLERLLRQLETIVTSDEAELWEVARDFFQMDLDREGGD